ncbi:DUF4270 domain-containing protein [Euzebyella saccharophila]|uniref:DUF4270 family protein n=1 Tax=Euzebyella saccharophila TaxID=679664 RepID=A0ABV8JL26_9FLAO|nr:DUF4270 domain-containing protein [Euzebyella saccharophila]
MTFFKRFFFSALAAVSLMLAVVACEEDPTTIGSGVIGSSPFTTDKAVFDVFAYNKKIEAVSTNKLPLYQLGSFTHPVYGKTEATVNSQVQLSSVNPTFGVYSQAVEDDPSDSQIAENEKVEAVYLYIPFLINPEGDSDGDGLIDELDKKPNDAASDSDEDGVSDAQEIGRGTNPNNPDTDGDDIPDGEDNDFTANQYQKTLDVDSVYVGGKAFDPSLEGTMVNLRVERSNYYLRDLDPSANFQEAQEYYSNQEFAPSFVDSLLFDGQVALSRNQIPVQKRDDSSTEDVDESETFTYLGPGIRVALDADFFQNNILDKEGSSELTSQENFKDFFRGINFTLNGVSEEVMMLFDLKDANITITYSYDTTDGEGEGERDYVINFLTSVLSNGQATGIVNGNAANTLKNDTYPADVMDAIGSEPNAEKIYLKGGSGSYAEIKLFDEENGTSVLNQIKNNNWIVNEANLVFYVADESNVAQPPSLYLFNTETLLPLYNTGILQSDQASVLLEEMYGGELEETTDGQALKYTIRITEHINDLLLRDVENATLGVTLTSSPFQLGIRDAMLSDDVEEELPTGNTLTPLGTVLYGNNVSEGMSSKKLQLEISYTETE